jgi:hypothetical protein
VHDDAAVEAPGLDEVEAQRRGQRAEQRLSAAGWMTRQYSSIRPCAARVAAKLAPP